MFAALLICLVAFAAAQRPVPCTTPPQWEGRVFDIDEPIGWTVRGRLSYDSPNHRERFLSEFEEGSLDDFYETLALFDLRVEFIYNFRARNCTRREITRPWRDFGIRANDTSYGEAYIGSSAFPGSGVLATIWGGNITMGNYTAEFFATWTYQGCLPISRTVFSRTNGVQHISFFDITLGISDPNVFIPRRECLSDEEWANRYTLFGSNQ